MQEIFLIVDVKILADEKIWESPQQPNPTIFWSSVHPILFYQYLSG